VKRKFRWTIILGLVALVAVAVIARLAAPGASFRRPVESAVPVEIARARLATIPVYLSAVGTVVPYRTVTVQPMITGPLLDVFFHEGQNVRKGQLIAEIDPQPFAAALEQAEAKLTQDEAALESDTLTLHQDAELVKKGFVSLQTYTAARATWLAAKALIEQDKAALRTARINLGYTHILAPISGRTGLLQVDPGNIVSPTLANGIVTINTLQPIYVQFSLPQQDLPDIVRAMHAGAVRLLVTLKNASAPATDQGVLTALDNQINAGTGTLTLRGRFPNPRLDLWPGAFVNVRVLVRTLRRVVVVPNTAVRDGPAGRFVYLVEGTADHPKVVIHPIVVAYENTSLAVVGKGLVPGDTVVTQGGSRIHARTPIEILNRTAPTP